MSRENLFTMLSSYRPGTPATPFAVYCTQGLAYVLRRGHRGAGELMATRAGFGGSTIAAVEVQAPGPDGLFADLALIFEDGQRVDVEVQIELGGANATSPATGRNAGVKPAPGSVLLALPGDERSAGRPSLSWEELATALDESLDPLTTEYAEFIRRDVLGQGEVPLDEAITTNRLYALGAAALRRRFGNRVSYQSSASRPLAGRYRYIGTTFSIDGSDLDYWIGLVNEQVPLSEHYHLMLASKHESVSQPVEQPRATGDWKWAHWTGLGRIVRPLTPEACEELLGRLAAPSAGLG